MPADDDIRESAPFELAAAMVAVVVTGFAAAWLFPGADPVARVLVMATAAGLLAAWVADWRVCVAVASVSALVFVGFLTHRYGVLTGDPTPWGYTPLVALAAVLGRAHRWTRLAEPIAREVSQVEVMPASAPGARRLRRCFGPAAPLD